MCRIQNIVILKCFVEEQSDPDGWETVHRTSRGRYRSSPAQSSKLHSQSGSSSNRSSPAQGSIKSNTDTNQTPPAQANRETSQQTSNPAYSKNLENIQIQKQIVEYSQNNKVMVDEIEEEFLKQSEGNRKRTYSRESEKENKPANIMEKKEDGVEKKADGEMNAWAVKAVNVNRYVDGDEDVTLDVVTMDTDLGMESEDDKEEEELANQIEQVCI